MEMGEKSKKSCDGNQEKSDSPHEHQTDLTCLHPQSRFPMKREPFQCFDFLPFSLTKLRQATPHYHGLSIITSVGVCLGSPSVVDGLWCVVPLHGYDHLWHGIPPKDSPLPHLPLPPSPLPHQTIPSLPLISSHPYLLLTLSWEEWEWEQCRVYSRWYCHVISLLLRYGRRHEI